VNRILLVSIVIVLVVTGPAKALTGTGLNAGSPFDRESSFAGSSSIARTPVVGITETTADDVYFGVGDVRPLVITVSNVPAQYRNTTIRFTLDSNEYLDYNLTGTGGFSDVLTLTMVVNSSGSGVTETYYAKGTKVTPGILQFTATSSNPAAVANLVKDFAVAQVTALRWIKLYPYPDYYGLSANPNAGGGLRIFTDRDAPLDGPRNYRWDQVAIQAVIEPSIPGMHVGFKLFDMDDPSSDVPPVDLNGGDGNDNRGYTNSSIVSKQAGGTAVYIAQMSQQPGDNYKAAATVSYEPVTPGTNAHARLGSMVIDGLDLRSVAGGGTVIEEDLDQSPNPGSSPFASRLSTRLLTVWRRLHIERDSMATVHSNGVKGTVRSVSHPDGEYVLTLNTASPLEFRRFEGGSIKLIRPGQQGTISLAIFSSETDSITLADPIPPNENPTGWDFMLFDDDDFNNNDTILDGDSGEEIPAPDMSLLADSDDPVKNKLARAYIRPKYDLRDGEDSGVLFELNVPSIDPRGPSPDEIRDLYRFDNVATEADSDFWTIYVLNAYQDFVEEDYDPLIENPDNLASPLGRVDGIGDGWGMLVFVEAIADLHRYRTSVGRPIQAGTRPGGVVLHEAGHLFGCLHEEGGVMGSAATIVEFSDESLNVIRSAVHP